MKAMASLDYRQRKASWRHKKGFVPRNNWESIFVKAFTECWKEWTTDNRWEEQQFKTWLLDSMYKPIGITRPENNKKWVGVKKDKTKGAEFKGKTVRIVEPWRIQWDDLEEGRHQAAAQIGKYNEKLASVTEESNKLRDMIAEFDKRQVQIDEYQRQITNIHNYLARQDDDTTSIESEKSVLVGLNDDREGLRESKADLNEAVAYSTVITELLKDTGIKTKIIKEYIPVINALTNKYLQVLDFFVSFHLDDTFKESIKSRHRDEFSYDSFSEGEKQRIDLALLFTWRQVAKMKNSVATNLLILDETFDSSLDVEGVDNLTNILDTLGDDTNVFIISHKGELLEGKFEDKIEFVKRKNFSVIA